MRACRWVLKRIATYDYADASPRLEEEARRKTFGDCGNDEEEGQAGRKKEVKGCSPHLPPRKERLRFAADQ